MIKLETISQIEGFGNDIPKSQGEHYRSVGMSRRMTGLSNVGVIEKFFSTADFASMGNPIAHAFGNGRDPETDAFVYNYLYSQDSAGYIYDASISYTVASSVINAYKVAHKNITGAGKGILVDQKGRILYPQLRYLGMYDPNYGLVYSTGTIAVTNGSSAIVGTGTTFTSSMVGKRLIVGSDTAHYYIASYTDATHITIDKNYAGTTAGTSAYVINKNENYHTGTVSVTNGSADVVGTGTVFASIMASGKKAFKIAGENTIYNVETFTDATHIVLDRAYEGNTGALKSYMIYEAWNDSWKDFGSDLKVTTDNKTAYCAMDIYEDTVVIGRNNVVMTLNTVSDTMSTTALTLPTQIDILTVTSGSPGILLGCNFRNKGVLILWDNYSDRSIAPWIYLNEAILGVGKSGDGWVVQTTKNIYFTNGYSLQVLASNYLGTSIEATELFGAVFTPFQLCVSGENVFMQIAQPTAGRKRAGLYRFNLSSRLFEYYPPSDMIMYGIQIYSLYYANDKLLVGYNTSLNSTNTIGILNEKKAPRVSSFISMPVGMGNNYKVMEGIRLNLGINSLLEDTAIDQKSFAVALKIAPVERQLNHYAVVKTTTADKLSVIVDGTLYSGTSDGDEVEFLNGDNAGYTRHIVTITNKNTDTETWTLDEELPSNIVSGVTMNISPFRKVGATQKYNSFRDIPEVYFNARKAFKGQQFMIKVEVSDATFAMEQRQFDMIYDDMGVIQ